MIIGGYQIGWNFENEWNGYESYIFIHYNTAIAGFKHYGYQNKESLLNDSPDNVHYFFIIKIYS